MSPWKNVRAALWIAACAHRGATNDYTRAARPDHATTEWLAPITAAEPRTPRGTIFRSCGLLLYLNAVLRQGEPLDFRLFYLVTLWGRICQSF